MNNDIFVMNKCSLSWLWISKLKDCKNWPKDLENWLFQATSIFLLLDQKLLRKNLKFCSNSFFLLVKYSSLHQAFHMSLLLPCGPSTSIWPFYFHPCFYLVQLHWFLSGLNISWFDFSCSESLPLLPSITSTTVDHF